MKGIKFRLIVMNFLQFAVWGAYLTCMGNYLGKAGMGDEIEWFYIIQGLVSIFMPTLLGIVGDKWIQPQRLLGFCHLITAACMICLFYLGLQAANASTPTVPVYPNKVLFITIYTIGAAFYMPTLALSNTAAFTILKDNGMDTVKAFPPIRVFGTIGFIISMWFVNCAFLKDGQFGFTFGENSEKFQYTYYQFLVSGILGIFLFLYSFTLPQCKIIKKEATSLADSLGLSAFKLFKVKKMALFFIFAMLLGMALQVTNTYATPFLTHFKSIESLSGTFAANNATMLVSISQVSEALCILLIPFFLRRYGIKVVMLMAMVAWVLRFGFFGVGSPDMPGVLLFILSCIVYGVAFDFFNVSGAMFVDKECDSNVKASAQGLFMLMTNGLGGSIGIFIAGKIVKNYCNWTADGFLVGDWKTTWLIFAVYALVVAILFAILFKYKHQPEKETKA
ncbi:MAG: MFS transporter [Bacteroidales bacterium]|nr:MFS transporter [Bacteroidales bacterium]